MQLGDGPARGGEPPERRVAAELGRGRPHGARRWTSLLALCAVLLLAPPHPMEAAAAGSQPRYGSTLTFHGWSANSRFVAYTRVRHQADPHAPDGERREVQRMHRQVRRGVFVGFGSWVGGEVEALAQEHGYAAVKAPRERISDDLTRFRVGDAVFDVAWRVGDRVGWELRRGDTVLGAGAFDTPYLAGEFTLFPSPDGEQALLVARLDAGWVIDTAVFPVPLGAALPPRPSDAPSR